MVIGIITLLLGRKHEEYLRKRKEDPTLRLGRMGYIKDEQSYKEEYHQELSLLRKGISLRNVQKITGTSIGTLQKIKKYFNVSSIS